MRRRGVTPTAGSRSSNFQIPKRRRVIGNTKYTIAFAVISAPPSSSSHLPKLGFPLPIFVALPRYFVSMPKDRRSRSVSFDRPSPFPCRSFDRRRRSPLTSSAGGVGSSSSNPPRNVEPKAEELKEWDEIRCPVCMEHPHNAILLLCASNDKGCRPFMCDTSYRHSNCLDQYRKASDAMAENEGEPKPKLSCPLCRGAVFSWKVVEAARKYMNGKARSCSTESCGFTGAYGEIRRHARTEHPSVRPSEADPVRQRDWRRMEQQSNLGDLLSTMQSAIDGEDEGMRFLAEVGEFGGSPPLSSSTLFLVLRFQGAGGLSGSTVWSSARRGLSSSEIRRIGRAARFREAMASAVFFDALDGGTHGYDYDEVSSRVVFDTAASAADSHQYDGAFDDDDNGNGGSEEVPGTSRRS